MYFGPNHNYTHDKEPYIYAHQNYMIYDESSDEETGTKNTSSSDKKKVTFQEQSSTPSPKVHQTRSRTKNTINTVQTYVAIPPTPTTVKEALDPNNPHHKDWLLAINKEIEEFLRRDVFEQVPLEKYDEIPRALQSKLAFKIKREPDNTLLFKARLVIKGYKMIHGIDYIDKESPTINQSIIMTVLHVAATLNYNISGCDIGNAYLEALLNDELYMELPKDYTQGQQVIVRLKKNIYGTKQAARV